jgi:hypothetical protein
VKKQNIEFCIRISQPRDLRFWPRRVTLIASRAEHARHNLSHRFVEMDYKDADSSICHKRTSP